MYIPFYPKVPPLGIYAVLYLHMNLYARLIIASYIHCYIHTKEYCLNVKKREGILYALKDITNQFSIIA
jgi:hypothetical protein